MNRGLTFIYIILFIVLGFFLGHYLGIAKQVKEFVSGKYGTICYPAGQENKNIKYPIRFSSLEDCEKYINNQE